MRWTVRNVVAIGTGSPDQPRLLGTGFLVAGGKVVTARHVVVDRATGARHDPLLVRRNGSPAWVPGVTWRWSGAGKVDVAVLDVPAQPDAPADPLAVLVGRRIERHAPPWGIDGYPIVDPVRPSESLEQASGTPELCEEFRDTLFLNVSVAPPAWNGMSGAAVVIDDRVQGVIRGVRDDWSNERITATPVAQFLHDRGFLDALGLGTAAEALHRRIARVKQRLQRTLDDRDQDRVAAALVERLGCTRGALAEELVEATPAEALVRLIQNLHGEDPDDDDAPAPLDPAARDHDRDVLADLLFRVLPYARDWRAELVSCLARGRGEPDVLLLSSGSATVAEAILAGWQDRACRFEGQVDQIPVAVAEVQFPTASRGAMFDNPDRLLENVVRQLKQQLTTSGVDEAEMRQRVQAALDRLRDHGRRYHLVVPDPEPGATHSRVARAVAHLHGRSGLPLLVIVRVAPRLTDSDATIDDRVADVLKSSPPHRP